MERGQKVKYIADKVYNDKATPKEYHNITYPKKGQTYIIRQVVRTDYGDGLLLEEIKNPIIHHDQGGAREPIFGTNRFELI